MIGCVPLASPVINFADFCPYLFDFKLQLSESILSADLLVGYSPAALLNVAVFVLEFIFLLYFYLVIIVVVTAEVILYEFNLLSEQLILSGQ